MDGRGPESKRIDFILSLVGCPRWVLRGVVSRMCCFVLLGDWGVASWVRSVSPFDQWDLRPPSLIGTDGHKRSWLPS